MKKPLHYIRRSTNHGRECWLADLPPSFTGKPRVRRFFAVRSDAEAFVLSYHGDVRAYGEEAASWLHQMSPSERARLVLCLQRLYNIGWTLEAAVEFIEKHGKEPPAVALGELVRKFLLEKEGKSCRPRHLRKVKNTLRRFIAGRVELPASEIMSDHVREFVNRNGWRPATRKSYLIDLRSFFAFAVRQKLLRDNPAEAVEFPILDDKPPGILTVETCQRVLDTCQRTDPGLLPFVALILFVGMRTQEALRFTMDDLRPDFIEVKAHKAKTRRRRLIPITPQVRAWMEAGFAAGGTLPPENWQRRWKKVRVRANAFKAWPNNAARHSFVSYHFAKFKSASETASIAGHSEQMLFAHYREVVNPADADTFYGLLPNPQAVAAGVQFDCLPKHVPPQVFRRLAEEMRSKLIPLPGSPSPRECDPANLAPAEKGLIWPPIRA